jgi:hypothetical protein
METINDRTILSEIMHRFTEPAKYKIKFYQIAVLMYIDQILTLVINKYMFYKFKIEEKKPNLKIIKFQQSQIKLDLFSNENFKRSSALISRLKQNAVNEFGKFCFTNYFALIEIFFI